MDEYESLGHMSEITPAERYLPHHASGLVWDPRNYKLKYRINIIDS